LGVEPIIHQVNLHREDLSAADTGGGLREVVVNITVDSSLPIHRQKESAVYELLGAYLATVVDQSDLEEIAEAIVDLLSNFETENFPYSH
jgi:hypothetical protein